jgi:hypothetical protein
MRRGSAQVNDQDQELQVQEAPTLLNWIWINGTKSAKTQQVPTYSERQNILVADKRCFVLSTLIPV